MYHPDKTLHIAASERAQRENLFKLANVAFEVLPDPIKRAVYDRNLRAGHSWARQQGYKTTARPASDYRSSQTRPGPQKDNNCGSSHTSTWPPEGTQSLQRAPLSTHCYSDSTLGSPPDFKSYHSEVNEYSSRTTITYSNWHGWRFSVDVVSRFKVIAKPVIPEKPVSESICVSLPLRRKQEQLACATNDVIINMRHTWVKTYSFTHSPHRDI